MTVRRNGCKANCAASIERRIKRWERGQPTDRPTKSRWSQVTQYFFGDCVYYTPAFSDEYLGRLQLRDLVSVADGMRKPNLYLGEEILFASAPAAPARRTFSRLRKKLFSRS